MGGTWFMAVASDKAAYIDRIGNATAFRYLTDAEKDDFLENAELFRFEENETVVEQGIISQYLYVLIEGGARVSVSEPGEEPVELSSIMEGEVFGESAIFLTVKTMAKVVCKKPSAILKIHRKSVIAFFRKYPHAGNKILMLIIYSLLNKLRTSNLELVNEKQAVFNLDHIDSYFQETITES